MASKKTTSQFLVHYRDPKDNSIQSLKVGKIEDSSLGLSFVRLSDFIFTTDSLLIKPAEEQLQKRLENVKSLHISIYHIIAIEELGVVNTGLKFRHNKAKLLTFPTDSGLRQ